jgi:YidC/Oxa1 family membrane protein insertase
MEERRLLLAVAVSLLIITAWGYLFPPTRRPVPSPTASSPGAVATPGAPAAAPSPSSSATPAPTPGRPRVADEGERRVEVVTQDINVAFTTRGARLLSWQLKRFKDRRGRPEEMVMTVPEGPRSLDIETGDAAIDARLREALFRPRAPQPLSSAPEVTVTVPVGGETTVWFEFSDGDLSAEKSLTFRGEGYLARVGAAVRQGGREIPRRVIWGPGLGTPTAEEMEVQGYQAPQGVVLAGGGVDRIPPAKLATPRPVADAWWLGVESHYFVAVFVPPGDRGSGEMRAITVPARDDKKPQLEPLAVLDFSTSPGPALLYVGPKDHKRMAQLGHRLSEVVPVGDWIGPIVVMLMSLLEWVNSHVHNYGWAIVLLTVLINLAMAPLRHYSIANGLKMAKVAPEMKVIQDRYRKLPLMDPKRQEMQQEIGQLYARHGMNMGTQMMVGCLPLLLTMPFLIAFYRVLQVSIELRGASFLWIPDLSQKDPLFITPIFMGLSMFVMQKITPTTMDPAQQRIMMIMPIMFMGMFLWAPAGLNLYWLASNVCSIIQQAMTLQILRGREGAASKGEKKRK